VNVSSRSACRTGRFLMHHESPPESKVRHGNTCLPRSGDVMDETGPDKQRKSFYIGCCSRGRRSESIARKYLLPTDRTDRSPGRVWHSPRWYKPSVLVNIYRGFVSSLLPAGRPSVSSGSEGGAFRLMSPRVAAARSSPADSPRATRRAVPPKSRPWVHPDGVAPDQVERTAAAMYWAPPVLLRPHVQALVQGESRLFTTLAPHAAYNRQPTPSQAECRRFEPGHPLFPLQGFACGRCFGGLFLVAGIRHARSSHRV
jgi:hypothetical protein